MKHKSHCSCHFLPHVHVVNANRWECGFRWFDWSLERTLALFRSSDRVAPIGTTKSRSRPATFTLSKLFSPVAVAGCLSRVVLDKSLPWQFTRDRCVSIKLDLFRFYGAHVLPGPRALNSCSWRGYVVR